MTTIKEYEAIFDEELAKLMAIVDRKDVLVEKTVPSYSDKLENKRN